MYTNRWEVYRAVPRPHLGFSDHISILPFPAHHPVIKGNKPTQKTITVWPSGAVSMFQDCFERTNWQVFREAAIDEGRVDLEEHVSSVCGYISRCIDVTTTRNITIHPRNPGWLAYRKSRSVSDAVSAVLHSALTHLGGRDSFVRLITPSFRRL